jgi:hypothetical protein
MLKYSCSVTADEVRAMNDKDKLLKLREIYSQPLNDVARKVLDYFANKTNWCRESFVHRICQETQLSDRAVRAFLKEKLEEELELGHFRKGAQGYKSRFIWDLDAGYSLVQVGLAAQGKSDTLLGDAADLISESDEEDYLTDEELVKIGKDRFFKAVFPRDLTEKEFEHFIAHMKLIHFS